MELNFSMFQKTDTEESLEREYGREDNSWLGNSANEPKYNNSQLLIGARYFIYIIINPYNTITSKWEFLFADVDPEIQGELRGMTHITHKVTEDEPRPESRTTYPKAQTKYSFQNLLSLFFSFSIGEKKKR